MIDHGLELLDDAQSWTLVEQGEVGRVGVTIGALPAIFPVNYRVIDGDIVFRTAPGSKLEAASRNAIVAFEVDDYDRADRSGWSVLIVGRSEVIHDLVVTRLVVDAGLEPFADGRRSNLVRITPEMVTGRRIVHEEEGLPSPLA
jgi:nitroimidazol reductase NimA-like FMN-containing flavoprotein (pyridoxamine 5'-phosphate oxidase superfamily)